MLQSLENWGLAEKVPLGVGQVEGQVEEGKDTLSPHGPAVVDRSWEGCSTGNAGVLQ